MSERVQRTKQFYDWYDSLSEKQQGIVDGRVGRFEEQGLLIGIKPLSKELGLFEFKWRSGMRVYFSLGVDDDGRVMVLLLGGNKNSQAKDINLAKKLLLRAWSKLNEKEN